MAPRIAHLLWTLALGFSAPSGAAVRCDLDMADHAPGACIDPEGLDGRTLRIPANITRIGEEGLALCTPTQRSLLSADLVYVIDNSASMDAWGFHASASGDTTWYIPDCAEAGVPGTPVALRRRHFGATGVEASGWDTLVELRSKLTSGQLKNGCMEANDPYSMRAEAVRVALRHQASLDPASQAGVIFFNSKVQQKFRMRPLSETGLGGLLDSTGMYSAASGTSWAPPIDSALRWLSEVPVSGRSKAIILVSDGMPFDRTKWVRLIGGDAQPPVYGIYLGKSEDPTPDLDTITALSFGQKFVVPPNRPDSLEGVIKSIITSVTVKDAPTTSHLRNLTVGQESKALTLRKGLVDDWSLVLDSALALAAGPNLLQWITGYRTTSGAVLDTSTFLLDVASESLPLGNSPLPATPFAGECFEASRLEFLGPDSVPVPSVTEAVARVGVSLVPSGKAPLPLGVQIVSGAGDAERQSLGSFDVFSPGRWGRFSALAVARVTPPIPSNAVFEVRSGIDTLRGAWCHPRDARDCAEGSLEVLAQRDAALRWIPGTTTGPRGSLLLEAILPGQIGTFVEATIHRRGALLARLRLTRVQDSLFRADVPFAQGPRLAGGDSLALPLPPTLEPDSLVAYLVWGLLGDTLSDVARIVRTPPMLRLDWTGSRAEIQVTLDGGSPDPRGERPVQLTASGRSLRVVLDSLGREVVDASTLATGGRGLSVMVRGMFLDPVFGDTVWDSVAVPVPRMSLQYTIRNAVGPTGTLELHADLPGATEPSVRVGLVRRGGVVGFVDLARAPDSSYRGSFFFRQGPARPLGDSLWLPGPDPKLPDSIAAFLVLRATGDTLRDTALVHRPPSSLTLRSDGASGVHLAVQGGQSDGFGRRVAVVFVVSPTSVDLDSTGQGRIDLLDQLVRVASNQARVRAVFVDPVYGDTLRDSLNLAVPTRSIRFSASSVAGPRGSLRIVVQDPFETSLELGVVLVHGRDSFPMVLLRGVSGTFEGEIPFSQLPQVDGDTLALGRPRAGIDSLFAWLPVRQAQPALFDRSTILRPTLMLNFTPVPGKPHAVAMHLEGGNADPTGTAEVAFESPPGQPKNSLRAQGDLTWSGERDLGPFLEESLDSVTVRGRFVDPVYGDTAWAVLRIPSPWFPSRLEVSPLKIDPRDQDSVWVRVWDKDPDSLVPGTVRVTVGTEVLELRETGRHTGEYVLRTSADRLDPRWGNHAPRDPWRMEVEYIDPDHRQDRSTAWVVLEFDVPLPDLQPRETLIPAVDRSGKGGTVLQVRKPDAQGHFPRGSQGVEMEIWETSRVLVYLYDNLGIGVSQWEGRLKPRSADSSQVYRIVWNGLDAHGAPAPPGIYLMRTVLIAMDGTLLENKVYTLGRR
ncbi:MAG: VWA domain-containing protein [Fibrobacteria bacterium]|nr:VWA domain-containing protein [Fibrobacteria bacterium]